MNGSHLMSSSISLALLYVNKKSQSLHFTSSDMSPVIFIPEYASMQSQTGLFEPQKICMFNSNQILSSETGTS